MRTEKTTAVRQRRSEAEAEILEACQESEAVAMAVSVLLDVVKTLRTRYAWTAEEIHAFLEALNEEQEKRLREEAMEG